MIPSPEMARQDPEVQNPFQFMSPEQVEGLVKQWKKEVLEPRQIEMIKKVGNYRKEARARGEKVETLDTKQELDEGIIARYAMDPEGYKRKLNELIEKGALEMEVAETEEFLKWYEAKQKEAKSRTAAA